MKYSSNLKDDKSMSELVTEFEQIKEEFKKKISISNVVMMESVKCKAPVVLLPLLVREESENALCVRRPICHLCRSQTWRTLKKAIQICAQNEQRETLLHFMVQT
eukprot:scaffold209721_cov55-Attheya_sp.AAC.1